MAGLAVGVVNSILNAMCKGTAYTLPRASYVQLHTGDPGSAGTAHIATNNTRQACTFNVDAATGSIANSATTTWPAVPATETYTYFSVWTAATSGTFCFSGAITNGDVTDGQLAQFAVGALVVSMTVAS